MKINEKNKAIYESCFIGWSNPYPFNESMIPWEAWDEDEENLKIPEGGRDYDEARADGLKKLFETPIDSEWTIEEFEKIVRGEEPVSEFDHIKLDGIEHIVAGESPEHDHIFITDKDDETYFVNYENNRQ